MPTIALPGCTATPPGSYLEALGILRWVSEQADAEALGWWADETFAMESTLHEEELKDFFIKEYAPTPILAPWNYTRSARDHERPN
jgi:CRISPR-associated protein Csx17